MNPDVQQRYQAAIQGGVPPDQAAQMAYQYQLTQQNQQSQPAAANAPAPQAAAPSGAPQHDYGSVGNWLVKEAPTIGGIAGGILGTPLDLLSGPAGNIAGAAGGQALGQVIKNKLTGQNITQDVGKEAGTGAIAGLGGEILGPVVGKVLGGAGKAAEDVGTGLISGQANLTRNAARSLALKDTTQELANAGITNVNNWSDAAAKVTGQNGLLPKLVRGAVGQAGPVNTDGVMQMAQDIATNEPNLPDNVASKFVNFVQKGLTSAHGGAQGSIATGSNPLDVFGFIQDLGTRAAELTRGNPQTITSQDRALADSYRKIASELEDRLYTNGPAGNVGYSGQPITGAGADGMVAKNMTPQTVQQIQDLFPGNKKWASYVTNKLGDGSAATVSDLRSFQKPFVNASKIANETEAASQLSGQTMGGAVKGLGKLVQNPLNLLAVPLSSDTASSLGGTAARSIGNSITKPGVQNLAAQAGGQAIANNVVPGNPSDTGLDTAATSPSPTDTTTPPPTGAGSPTSPQFGSSPLWSPQQYAQAVQWDIGHTGGRNLGALQQEYQVLGRPKLTDQSAQTMADFQDTGQKIDQAINMLQKNQVKNLGPLGALANRTEQKVGLNGEAGSNNFDTLSADITNSYLKAMGGVRGVDASTLRKANAAILPDLGLSKQVNLQRLQQMKAAIAAQQNNLLNTLNTYGSMGTSVPASPSQVQFSQ